MKKMTYFVMALALVLGFTQCKKEQTPTNNGSEGVFITLDVNGGHSNSKVIVDPVNYGTNLNGTHYATVAYENGDVVYVGYKGAYVGQLTYNGSLFTGNINATPDLQNKEPLHFYFLGGVGFTPTIDATNNTATVNISDQTSTYPVISYAPSDSDYNGAGSYSAKLQNKCSIVKFNFPNGMTAPVRVGGVYTKAVVDFANHSITPSDIGTIKLHSVNNNDNDKWGILLPQSFTSAPSVIVAGMVCTVTLSDPLSSPLTISNNAYINNGISVTNTPAVFSVGNKAIQFSPGNLQATTNDLGDNWTWSFAENQLDCIGRGVANTRVNGNGTVSENGTVDLFGLSNGNTNHYGIHNSTNDADYDMANFVDWGGLISDSYNWRTPTNDDWTSIIRYRSTNTTVNGTVDARFAKTVITMDDKSIKGILIFPNNYNGPTTSNGDITWGAINGYNYFTTTCTAAGWASLEAAGCVFLPAGGYRYEGNKVETLPGDGGYPCYGGYWSSTVYNSDSNQNHYFVFGDGDKFNWASDDYHHIGHSVRLIRDVE